MTSGISDGGGTCAFVERGTIKMKEMKKMEIIFSSLIDLLLLPQGFYWC
jgi:hypothetical protein